MTIQEEKDRARSEEWLTVKQYALLVQYDPQTVWRKIRRNEIPGVVHHGRSIRIRRTVALSLRALPSSSSG